VSPLLFLAAAFVISVIGSVVVLASHRRRPHAGDELDDFARQMRALSPEGDPDLRARSRRR